MFNIVKVTWGLVTSGLLVSSLFLLPSKAMDTANENNLHQIQPTLGNWNHNNIKNSLSKSSFKKCIEKLNGNKGYIVKLEDDTPAVFKPRCSDQIFREVMAYEMASQLFDLKHTIPPTVFKNYADQNGILQYYVKPEFDLSSNLSQAIREANRDSYADLQTFLFCSRMGDVNEDGIIPWRNSQKSINFTYVDSQFLFNDSTLYGKQSPARKATLDSYDFSYPKDVFTSKFTSYYNPHTIERMRNITSRSILNLWREVEISTKTSYKESQETTIKGVMSNIDEILQQNKFN